MRYLCLDTSAGSSVALVDSTLAQPVLAQTSSADSRTHAEHLSEMVATVVGQAGYASLPEANINYVVVGRGPAPFTGLRAGLITARAIAFALQKPVIGVCSLDALARATLDRLEPNTEVLVTSDARRKEVYAAAYRDAGPDGVECLWGPEVGRPEDFANRAAKPGVVAAGQGTVLYPEAFPREYDLPVTVEAAVLARLADHLLVTGGITNDPELQTAPLYLRRPDVSVPAVAQK